jgi:hypothetical protein
VIQLLTGIRVFSLLRNAKTGSGCPRNLLIDGHVALSPAEIWPGIEAELSPPTVPISRMSGVIHHFSHMP